MLIMDCTKTCFANFHRAIDICRNSCFYFFHRCCCSKKRILAKSTHQYDVARMLNFTVFHHCRNKFDISAPCV